MQLRDAAELTTRICEALGEARYRNLPLAPLVEVPLYTALMHDHDTIAGRRAYWWARSTVLGNAMNAALRGLLGGDRGRIGGRTPALLWTHAHPRFWEPVAGAARHIEGALLLLSGGRPPEPWSGRLCEEQDLPLDLAAWYDEVVGLLPTWRALAAHAAHVVAGRPALQSLVMADLIWGSCLLRRVLDLLDVTRPEIVALVHDHQPLGAALCLAARARGIRSVTFQHGLLDDATVFLTFPLVADHYLAWGESDAALLRAAGLPAGDLSIVGAPRVRPRRPVAECNLDAARAVLLARGVPDGARVAVLLATVHDATNRELVRVFCDGIRRSPGWAGAVRAHPADVRGGNRAFIVPGVPVVAIEHGVLDLDQTAHLASAVVSHQTGAALELLAKGAVIVALDCLSAPIGYVGALARQHQAAYLAQSGEGLRQALASIALEDDSFHRIRERSSRALQTFCAAMGEAADVGAATAIEALRGGQAARVAAR